MDYKLKDDLKCQNEIYELISIEVNRPNYKNVIIGVVYRHHHHGIKFSNQVEVVISKITLENKPFYLTGDFNINILRIMENILMTLMT